MKKLMLGNEAIARGAYEAGVRVVSSYPGTPSTEITESIAKYDEIYSEWAPNEKVGLEVAAGASFAGGRAMSCMKHVGLNVAADPLFTVSYTGVNAGLVICVADDQGMHSSQNEQDSRHYALASKTLMLEPADSQECLDYVKRGFDLSERYDTPVLIRLSTRISHSQTSVEAGERRELPLNDYVKDPQKYVMMPAAARGRHIIIEERMKKLASFVDEDASLNKVVDNGGKIGVISAGIAYQYAKEALGDNVNYLKLGAVYPLPSRMITDFAKGLDKIYVIEELEPIIENHCKQLGLSVVGKDAWGNIGEYTASSIKNVVLGAEASPQLSVDEPIPVRPPVMCSGCPHRGLFYVLSKMKLNVTGDIGCYTLGALAPLEAIDAVVCMGASVGMAHGFEKARGAEFGRKTVAVIGDSTFAHSGITGLMDIVYNKGNATVIILDNSITGMTGHQHNPTTGYTIKGEPTKAVDLVKLAEAVGVEAEHIRVVDPFDVDALEKVIKEETSADAPSVIITRRPCALLKGVGYEGTYAVDDSKCKKCNICMKIGCPAITKADDRIVVDSVMCNGCGLCTNICKFGAFEKAGVPV